VRTLDFLSPATLSGAGYLHQSHQQRPEAGGTGYCSIERLVCYAEAPPFELIAHSWDIASTKGGGDWTVCAKFGLAKESDGRDILYVIGIVRMQIELPDVGEAIVGLDTREKPALIVLDGNGIGRGVLQELGQRQFKHVLAGADLDRGCSDGSKLRRFNDGLFNLYNGLVRFPNAMPGGALDTLLAEIAAFPQGKHDDQVDGLSYVAAYRGRVIPEARRRGLTLGRVALPRANSRSSRPNRAIRSSTTGDDNGVSVDTQSAKGRSRENLSAVGRRRADFDPPYGEATSPRWRAAPERE
jgi:phage terminase large subunit-like protein